MLGICPDFSPTIDGVQLRPCLGFVTPFFPQGSIYDYCKRPGNSGKSVTFLLSWALDIARGMAHMHEHNCVHRDLAARNVFIDENHHAVIGDLGLARRLDENGKFKSEGKSDHYPKDVAKEVIQHEEYSAASDVFDFGLTLFDIGSECKVWTPFTRTQSVAALKKKDELHFPSLVAQLHPSVPTVAVNLMLRCLAFEPTARPKSGEIIAELEKALTTTPPGMRWQLSHVSDFDTNGIFYNLATDGGRRPWQNPVEAGLIAMTSCPLSLQSPPISAILQPGGAQCVALRHDHKTWIELDFLDKRVSITHYTLRHSDRGDLKRPLEWRLAVRSLEACVCNICFRAPKKTNSMKAATSTTARSDRGLAR